MLNNVEVIFFDLFFTLIKPEYNIGENEHDILDIPVERWLECAEDEKIYNERALGLEKNPLRIVEKIIEKLEISIDEKDKMRVLEMREKRFARALINIEAEVLETLENLKKCGKRICLISNADVIDIMQWDNSPLKPYFENVIFSCEVGLVKPQKEIYELALKKMNISSEKCCFIGDGGSEELIGAKRMGIKTIATTQFFKREKEKHEKIVKYADYIIENIQEIIK